MAGDGSEPCREVVAIERRELTMETLGLTLAEGKALLAGVQDFVVAQTTGTASAGATGGWSPWRAATHQQSRWHGAGQHGVWPGQGAPSAMESLPLSKRRPEDLPPHEQLAQRTDQPCGRRCCRWRIP